ncbi:peptidase M15 family protein [filamentous cyanobacterium CCP5]|nr:peptidase M15 family protein [filamentous cyanobacterium CCP5]
MRIKAISDTLFKRQPKLSRDLADSEKVFVKNGSIFDIEFYVDVGDNHWRIELLAPTVGDQKTTSWYVYTPDVELLSSIILKVVSDTLFKSEPKLSTQLNDSQKIFVPNQTEYELASYLPAANNHTKVAIANAFLGPENRNTWYAYNPDVRIQGTRLELKVVSDTLFKTAPVLSSQLPAADKVFAKNGTVFELNSYSDADRNHVKVALEGAFLGPKNLTTWYAYAPDVEISGNTPGNAPKEPQTQPANPSGPGKALRFPGFDGVYYTNNPIIWRTDYGERGNFTWGEATHYGTRIPVSSSVVYRIIRICQALEEIRYRFGGRPMGINSWYRPPAINSAIGGATNSRHLYGDAVDFVVSGYHPYDVYAALNSWWGSKGGLASSSVFTHIDARGYRARWSYGY